jgi:hypothetical protein
MPTTWNPADNSDATLSGGNLIASFATTTAFRSCRATTFKNTGKWYFEDTISNTLGPAAGGWLAGMANSSASLTSYPGVDANSIGFENNGYVIFGGGLTFLSWVANTGLGHVIGFAVDIDNGRWWVRDVTTGSPWNVTGTSADPATGIAGFDITSLPNRLTTGITIAGCGNFGGATPEDHTLNAGASSFVGGVPGGFNAWDASGAVIDNPPFFNQERAAASMRSARPPIGWTMVMGTPMVPLPEIVTTSDNPPFVGRQRAAAIILAASPPVIWNIMVGSAMVPLPAIADEVRYNPLPLWGPLLAQ